jgi:hypothetical protein
MGCVRTTGQMRSNTKTDQASEGAICSAASLEADGVIVHIFIVNQVPVGSMVGVGLGVVGHRHILLCANELVLLVADADHALHARRST